MARNINDTAINHLAKLKKVMIGYILNTGRKQNPNLTQKVCNNRS